MSDYLRGHKIVNEDGQWRYLDNMEPTADNPRKCGSCDDKDREDGHDACIGELKGLMNACCGHGQQRTAYVQFLDGTGVHGVDATTIIEILKRQKD